MVIVYVIIVMIMKMIRNMLIMMMMMMITDGLTLQDFSLQAIKGFKPVYILYLLSKHTRCTQNP